MSRDSLGYDRVAFKANADGASINFQLHQRIKSSVSLPLTTAVAASSADLVIQFVWAGLLLPLLWLSTGPPIISRQAESRAMVSQPHRVDPRPVPMPLSRIRLDHA